MYVASHKMRRRGLGARMLRMKGRRYKLSWSGMRWSWWCGSYVNGVAV